VESVAVPPQRRRAFLLVMFEEARKTGAKSRGRKRAGFFLFFTAEIAETAEGFETNQDRAEL